MTNYQYLIIGGRMTAAAVVDGIRALAAIVREIKKRLSPSARMKDKETSIGMPAQVSLIGDERVEL